MGERLPWVRGMLVSLLLCLISGASASTALAASGPLLPSNDPFYSYSGSLASVAPGTVLRSRPVQVSEGSLKVPLSATQVLYRTSTELGGPTVTVATVIRPLVSLTAPKLLSYQIAYDALGPKCDPSYTIQGGNPSYQTNQLQQQLILGYVAAGYTAVVPDYETVGLDWGAGQESGYGTLDGIRAAEHLLGAAESTTPVALDGYSGGSIATEFATELAPSYAPGLNIVGAAEGGIPADFAHNLAYINGSADWSGVIPAVFVGVSRAFAVNLGSYLSPYGQQVARQVKDDCINSFLGAYPGLTYQKLLRPQYQNVLAVPVFTGIINHLIMSRTGTPREPLFMGVGNKDGTGDGVMIAGDVRGLAHTYCQRGVTVQFNEYQGLDHTQAAVPFEQGAYAFLTQRLNGTPVASNCSSIGVGNSLAPLPVVTPPHPGRAKLNLRVVGVNHRRHGLVVELWSTGGTLTRLVVRLVRGRRVIATLSVGRVTSAHRRLVLRRSGQVPPAGRYTLSVLRGELTLAARQVTIRAAPARHRKPGKNDCDVRAANPRCTDVARAAPAASSG